MGIDERKNIEQSILIYFSKITFRFLQFSIQLIVTGQWRENFYIMHVPSRNISKECMESNEKPTGYKKVLNYSGDISLQSVLPPLPLILLFMR